MMVAPDVWLSSLSKKIPEDQKDSTSLTIYACLVIASLIFAVIRAYGIPSRFCLDVLSVFMTKWF